MSARDLIMRSSLCICLGVLAFCAGCSSTRPPAYEIGRQSTEITDVDVRRAESYRELLPKALRLSPGQVKVEPGRGRSYVTILGVDDGQLRDSIVARIGELNANHPLHPVRLAFD